jgi:undecaprenyl-diphosphatase
VVLVLKLLIRRRRPPGEWGAIYRNTDPHSFPSGHAARAAMLAVLLCAWGPTWAAPVAIAWAPLVSLARVALGVHYLSDVIAGGVLGLAAGVLAAATTAAGP